MFARLAIVAALLLLPSAAHACPFCGSSTGALVRAGIFNDGFLMNLAVLLLPFTVLLAIVALVYGWPSSERGVA